MPSSQPAFTGVCAQLPWDYSDLSLWPIILNLLLRSGGDDEPSDGDDPLKPKPGLSGPPVR
jgi:hypothetical protein